MGAGYRDAPGALRLPRRLSPHLGADAEEGPRRGPLLVRNRRRPTLPGGLPPSTIGAGRLNFRVRDGNGCDPAALATETLGFQRAGAGTAA